jgi:hypothetical protein
MCVSSSDELGAARHAHLHAGHHSLFMRHHQLVAARLWKWGPHCREHNWPALLPSGKWRPVDCRVIIPLMERYRLVHGGGALPRRPLCSCADMYSCQGQTDEGTGHIPVWLLVVTLPRARMSCRKHEALHGSRAGPPCLYSGPGNHEPGYRRRENGLLAAAISTRKHRAKWCCRDLNSFDPSSVDRDPKTSVCRLTTSPGRVWQG